MSSTAITIGEHPIEEFASQVEAGLTEVADVPAWSLGVGGQASVIVALSRVRAGLDELELRVLGGGGPQRRRRHYGGVVDAGVAGARHGPPGRRRPQ